MIVKMMTFNIINITTTTITTTITTTNIIIIIITIIGDIFVGNIVTESSLKHSV